MREDIADFEELAKSTSGRHVLNMLAYQYLDASILNVHELSKIEHLYPHSFSISSAHSTA